MEKILTKLHQSLLQLDPRLFIQLQEQGRLEEYLGSILLLPGDPEVHLYNILSPSKTEYLANILEEEYSEAYLRFCSSGVLIYELLNLAGACENEFREYPLEEDPDCRMLRYAVIGSIAQYLQGGQYGI